MGKQKKETKHNSKQFAYARLPQIAQLVLLVFSSCSPEPRLVMLASLSVRTSPTVFGLFGQPMRFPECLASLVCSLILLSILLDSDCPSCVVLPQKMYFLELSSVPGRLTDRHSVS